MSVDLPYRNALAEGFVEHVIALDPGERCGWATGLMGLDSLRVTGYGTMVLGDMALALAEAQDINVRHDDIRPDPAYSRLVWESWRPRRINGTLDWIENDRLLSAQLVGQIRLVGWMSKAELKEYSPTMKRRFQKTMPPQLVELQKLASEQHPQDALMHLWGWFFENWFSAEGDPQDCVID